MLPTCCKQEMNINMELGRFVELVCGKCEDTVYIKNDTQIQENVLSQALK